MKDLIKAIIKFLESLIADKPQAPIAQPEPQKSVDVPQAPILKSTPQAPIFEEIAQHLVLDNEPNKISYLSDTCNKILINITRYQAVEKITGVPWDLIASIHFMEASLDFKTMLHNGEPLNIKSRIVPVGVGPFATWEEAAVDALKREGSDNYKTWTFADCLKFAESMNGKGYRARGIYSPYVFSFTNYSSELGGFPRDHVFDPTYINKRAGVGAILLYLRKVLGA